MRMIERQADQVGDPGELVELCECESSVEATTLSTVLHAESIQHVIQGELYGALLGGGRVIHPRLLVARRDLDVATDLLGGAEVVGTEADGTPEGLGVCPVHERPGIATCDRCHTVLCANCDALGSPPLCEDCQQREAGEKLGEEARGSWAGARWVVSAIGLSLAVATVVIRLIHLRPHH